MVYLDASLYYFINEYLQDLEMEEYMTYVVFNECFDVLKSHGRISYHIHRDIVNNII